MATIREFPVLFPAKNMRHICALISLMAICAVMLSPGHDAFASRASQIKVSLEVRDSISVSIDGKAAGSDRIIQVGSPASGNVTYVVLD